MMRFPYVCPEPVLAKCSFLYINGSKMPFSAGLWRPRPGGALTETAALLLLAAIIYVPWIVVGVDVEKQRYYLLIWES